MRRQKAVKNIFFSLLLDIVTVLSGLIIPRLIISAFGSDTNGLVQSITSFLSYIVLLQSGVGTVIKAALYKPLAEKDTPKLSSIIKTAEKFFRKIAFATVAYLVFLTILFPITITPKLEWVYTASLITVIGIGIAAQYFFGITYQMVLEADQKSYVFSVIQIVNTIVNTVMTMVLVYAGCGIQLVKLGSAVIFVLRPIVLNCYANKHYSIDKSAIPDEKLIKQRWDGFAQAIAYFIHSKTDIFVLTYMATLSEVSIYSVYAMITSALSSIVAAINKDIEATIGNIIAAGEKKHLRDIFTAYSASVGIAASIMFATASVTVYKFIDIYTLGITDANYINETFGFLIITAEYFYCIRLPYNSLVMAAGKIKETKASAVIEAVINIVISVTLVRVIGLSGVALGTLMAMFYRIIYLMVYVNKVLIHNEIANSFKCFLSGILSYGTSVLLLRMIPFDVTSYLSWTIYAFIIFACTSIITIGIYFIFYRSGIVMLTNKLLRKK